MEPSLHQIPKSHFDSLKKIESGYWWYEGRLIWAKRFIRNWLEENVFTDPIFYTDLGCGTGGFGIGIQDQFAIEQTLLVDNNCEALNKISQLKDVQTLKINIESDFTLPFSPNLITCMDVIEHLEHDDLFLARVYNSLNTGGLLVLSTAAHPFLYSSWDKKLGHYRRYSKYSLIEKIEKAGFKIKHASYGWSFVFPLAPYRFLFSKRQEKLNYPQVSSGLNKALILASQWESRLSDWIPYPFGTSIFMAASKE